MDTHPLVASGSIEDILTTSPEGFPLISHRELTIERISAPDSMRPVRLPLVPPEDAEGPFGATARWIIGVIREANTIKAYLIAFATVLASINPTLSIMIHGHAEVVVRLIVSITGTVLAGIGMVILAAQKIMFIVDAAALASCSVGGGENALVNEVEITEGSVFDRHLHGGESALTEMKHGLRNVRQSFRKRNRSGEEFDTRESIKEAAASSSSPGRINEKEGAELV